MWTKEPWEYGGAEDAKFRFIKGDSIVVAGIPTCNYLSAEEKKEWDKTKDANAERIVTCVNSLAGLTNAEVRAYGPEVKEAIELLKEISERYPTFTPTAKEHPIVRAKTLLSRIEERLKKEGDV